MKPTTDKFDYGLSHMDTLFRGWHCVEQLRQRLISIEMGDQDFVSSLAAILSCFTYSYNISRDLPHPS